MSDHLRRHLAPLTPAAWAAVDAEATRTLEHFLGLRALVDVEGPRGWRHSAHSLGRTTALAAPVEGVGAALRRVQPLVELRAGFVLSRGELDAVERGAEDPDLAPLVEAARALAAAEDRLIVSGQAAAGITGVVEASPHPPLAIGDDYAAYPRVVARAVATLRAAGIGGPYGIAMGSRCYTGVVESTEHGGYPVLEHLRLILAGPLFWAPALDGAVVLSRRGGDHRLVLGEDLSIGYTAHDADTVELYLEESLAFQVLEPRAAVALTHR